MSSIQNLSPEPNTPPERKLPYNEEAEQYLLGVLLQNNESFYRVCDFLLPEHFFIEFHKIVYDIIKTLIQSGKTASPITVKTFLDEKTNASPVVGLSPSHYLFKITANATSIINAQDYGHLIKDLSIRRNLITLGEDVVNTAYSSPLDMPPERQIETAEKCLYDLAEKGALSKGFMSFSQALKQSIKMAEAAQRRIGMLSGIPSGFSALDHRTGGFQPSDLIIIAGRPGMGKTTFATNIAHHIADTYFKGMNGDENFRHNGGRVGFFSLEMSAEQLATRIISAATEICSTHIRRGMITDDNFEKLMDGMRKLQAIPLHIDETGGLSIAAISTRARRLKRQIGLDVLIIDYVQLIQGHNRNNTNRVQEITEVTTGLKALAKELNIPIIALSQLSRKVEEREDKRPQLADLRESGSIEQDADMVMFVYREEYYVNQRKPAEDDVKYAQWETDMEKAAGKAEVIIAKQRHGPTGTINLEFDGQFTRFVSIQEERAGY